MNRDNAKASAAAPAEESGGGAWEVPGYVKVMTDEQVEVLRKQIAIYATLCEHLVTTHHQGSIAGVRPGSNLYPDPLMIDGGMKFPARQRWTPTRMQLQILETIFGEENGGIPGKQRLQEITAELLQHGQVGETNVYSWFQNRRARAKRNQKRKQEAVATE